MYKLDQGKVDFDSMGARERAFAWLVAMEWDLDKLTVLDYGCFAYCPRRDAVIIQPPEHKRPVGLGGSMQACSMLLERHVDTELAATLDAIRARWGEEALRRTRRFIIGMEVT